MPTATLLMKRRWSCTSLLTSLIVGPCRSSAVEIPCRRAADNIDLHLHQLSNLPTFGGGVAEDTSLVGRCQAMEWRQCPADLGEAAKSRNGRRQHLLAPQNTRGQSDGPEPVSYQSNCCFAGVERWLPLHFSWRRGAMRGAGSVAPWLRLLFF